MASRCVLVAVFAVFAVTVFSQNCTDISNLQTGNFSNNSADIKGTWRIRKSNSTQKFAKNSNITVNDNGIVVTSNDKTVLNSTVRYMKIDDALVFSMCMKNNSNYEYIVATKNCTTKLTNLESKANVAFEDVTCGSNSIYRAGLLSAVIALYSIFSKTFF